MTSLIGRIEKRNDTNELIYKTKRDLQTEKVHVWLPGERWGERIVRKFGMDMYKQLYLKWIINKNLRGYSTWNSVQCYVAALDGRDVWGRMDMCICMDKSLRCSPEMITTSLIGYTPVQDKK